MPPLFVSPRTSPAPAGTSPRGNRSNSGPVALPTMPSLAVQQAVDAPRGKAPWRSIPPLSARSRRFNTLPPIQEQELVIEDCIPVLQEMDAVQFSELAVGLAHLCDALRASLGRSSSPGSSGGERSRSGGSSSSGGDASPRQSTPRQSNQSPQDASCLIPTGGLPTAAGEPLHSWRDPGIASGVNVQAGSFEMAPVASDSRAATPEKPTIVPKLWASPQSVILPAHG